MRTAPFYGKGMAFPMRINPATGGVAVSEGLADDLSLLLAYVNDRFSIRDPLDVRRNHVAEAILHILFTMKGEHDTLPEFGSRAMSLLFRPNDIQTQQEFETWLEVAIERWEKRAFIPVPDGVEWQDRATSGEAIDQGILAAALSPEAIKTQVPGNLVYPFVTNRQARAQEYPLGDVDAAGHDWCSRYHGSQVYERDGVRFIRPRHTKPIPPRPDDLFYEAAHLDTWLTIAYKLYQEIRFWWLIAECWVQDAAKRGEPRSARDITSDPEPGTLLRAPSRTRVLMELAA